MSPIWNIINQKGVLISSLQEKLFIYEYVKINICKPLHIYLYIKYMQQKKLLNISVRWFGVSGERAPVPSGNFHVNEVTPLKTFLTSFIK